MLTTANNEAITRTGPGTPMGEYLRRYWIPALCSEELPSRMDRRCGCGCSVRT